ncbi:DUF58 domain-containing protein [Acetivibrio cellulolyticus]|uniref:DUF58 domain-containing protein n=1 Tax=Acetivibrio cellulolyticus TaxID=35830 RepID=UPI0001E2D49B|nr:DUF58 domain-containing protein [Acetivibrio cellulolyticus]
MLGVHWFIIATVIVLYIQRLVYTRLGLRDIEYERYFSTNTAFVGEEIHMVECISNKKLLPLPWLRLESRIDPSLKFQSQGDLDIKYGAYHKSFFSLSPYKKITRRHKVKCLKRGFYSLNSAVITCGDALGLNETCKNIDLSSNLLVYPDAINVDEIPFPVRSWIGEIIVRRWILEDPFMILGIREYNYGDPLNHINWKATARSGDIKVHNLDHTSSPSLMIYLNVEDSYNTNGYVAKPDIIEKGIIYAASIVNYALSNGVETGFASNGSTIDQPKQIIRILPGAGAAQLAILLEAMAKIVIAQTTAFSTLIEEDIDMGTKNRDFLFITCYEDEDMEKQIDKLRGMGNSVEILKLDAEDGLVGSDDIYEKHVS